MKDKDVFREDDGDDHEHDLHDRHVQDEQLQGALQTPRGSKNHVADGKHVDKDQPGDYVDADGSSQLVYQCPVVAVPLVPDYSIDERDCQEAGQA